MAARERVRLMPEGEVALALVVDFLASCGLRRSLCVLLPEAGVSETDRVDLRRKLGLGEGDCKEPILSELLRQRVVPLQEEYSDEDFEKEEEEEEEKSQRANTSPVGAWKEASIEEDAVSDLDCGDDVSLEKGPDDESFASSSDERSLDASSVTDRADFRGDLDDVPGPHILETIADIFEPVTPS